MRAQGARGAASGVSLAAGTPTVFADAVVPQKFVPSQRCHIDGAVARLEQGLACALDARCIWRSVWRGGGLKHRLANTAPTRMELRMADTLLFSRGRVDRWLFTAKDGRVIGGAVRRPEPVQQEAD